MVPTDVDVNLVDLNYLVVGVRSWSGVISPIEAWKVLNFLVASRQAEHDDKYSDEAADYSEYHELFAVICLAETFLLYFLFPDVVIYHL